MIHNYLSEKAIHDDALCYLALKRKEEKTRRLFVHTLFRAPFPNVRCRCRVCIVLSRTPIPSITGRALPSHPRLQIACVIDPGPTPDVQQTKVKRKIWYSDPSCQRLPV